MNNDEAKKLVNKIIHKIYLNYKDIPHREHTYQEASDNVEDIIEIQYIIQRMIDRRNASYIQPTQAEQENN